MQHSFDVNIAKMFGVNEAIIINAFQFWIAKNKANNRNFYDGRYWTYNSVSAFQEMFPYMSESQIRRTLKKMQEQNIIMTGNYNKSSYDRTLWYAFTDYGESILRNSEIDLTNSSNGNDENVKPIPVNNHLHTTFNDTVNNSTSVQNVKKNRKKKVVADTPTLSELEERFGLEVSECIIDWLTYKQERNESYTPTGLKSQLTQIENKCLEYSDSAVIQCINESIANGWKGIIFDRIKKNTEQPVYSNPFLDPDL